VEFVQVQSRNRLLVAEWERGAGATGSSGTGAAAAVAAMVMLGLADRCCEVQFELGALSVNWRESDDVIELTGPAQLVMEGVYEFR
jgi:diaminopimelate epimerase